MTGVPGIDNLFLLGLGALIIFVGLVIYLIFGAWKFHKTPVEQRGTNDPKVQYFILLMVLIALLAELIKNQLHNVSLFSFIVSLLYLCFMAYLFLVKKLKLPKIRVWVTSALAVYSIIIVAMYFVK